MMQHLILAALLLAPAPTLDEVRDQNRQRTLRLQAQAVAALPGAGEAVTSVQVPLAGEASDSEGNRYTISGTLMLTIQRVAPPDPLVTKITAIKLAGDLTEQMKSGDLLTIEGTALVSNAPLRVQVAGKIATIVSASPTRIEIRAPATTTPVSGPVVLFWSTTAGWTERARSGALRLLPAGAVDGRGPKVRGFHAANGNPLGGVAVEGEEVRIRGIGFGATPGQVWLGGMTAQEVLSWADEEVRVRVRQSWADEVPATGLLQTYNPVSHTFEYQPITREAMLLTAKPLHLTLRAAGGEVVGAMAFVVRRP